MLYNVCILKSRHLSYLQYDLHKSRNITKSRGKCKLLKTTLQFKCTLYRLTSTHKQKQTTREQIIEQVNTNIYMIAGLPIFSYQFPCDLIHIWSPLVYVNLHHCMTLLTASPMFIHTVLWDFMLWCWKVTSHCTQLVVCC